MPPRSVVDQPTQLTALPGSTRSREQEQNTKGKNIVDYSSGPQHRSNVQGSIPNPVSFQIRYIDL